MRVPPELLRETHLVGNRCRERPLDADHFPVLRNAPFKWIGHSVLRRPYRMVRLHSVHSHVVACVAGEGRTVIDGQVRIWKAGQVLIAPVGAYHAFEIAGNGPWEIAWVFFEDRESVPMLKAKTAMLVEADIRDFAASLKMLVHEAAGAAHPTLMESLVAALTVYTRRLAGSEAVDTRLWRLWERVAQDVARTWTVEEMARIAGVSGEHLRRLCNRHSQRSPMEYLTLLRMRAASTRLRASAERIDDIAAKSGYSSVYSFSAAFRRWSGTPPGKYRSAAAEVR